MLTLKRLYLYTVLGVALAVLLVGLTELVRIVFESAGDTFGTRSYVSDDVRTELSWALALVVVAGPVFLVHLGLVRRMLRGPEVLVAEERACASRSTYFFIVLVATGVIAVARLLEVADTLLASAAFGHRPWDLAPSAADALVIGSAWAGHAWVRRHDLRSVPTRTAADWLTLCYLYGALFVTALLACVGIGNTLIAFARELLDLRPSWQSAFVWEDELTWALALALVAGGAWAVHWMASVRLLDVASRTPGVNRVHRFRRGYFLVIVLAAAAVSLISISMGLGNVFAELAGTWRPTEGSRLLEDAGGPLLLTLPFVAAWWWHLRRVAGEARRLGGADLALEVRRTGRLVVAFVGLVGLSVGLAWELQVLLDAISSTGQELLVAGDEPGDAATTALAVALVGLATWVPAWGLSQRDRRQDVTFAAAAVRRAYLLLVSGLSMVALMIALAFVIYQGARLLLETELIDDSSWAMAVLLVAAATLVYHLYCLRADMLAARAFEVPRPTGGEERIVEVIEISAPAGADFKVLNAAIRTELPDGFELHVVSP